jgi:hypothetical protein
MSSIVTLGGQGDYQYSCTHYTASTTTTAALTTTSTTITVTSATNLATFGAITIDSEIIYYDGINGNNLKNARRGKYGSTAAAHSSGAAVSQDEYLVTGQGGSPSLSASYGKVILYQAVFAIPAGIYYAAGTNGTNAIILKYTGLTWSTAFTGLSGVTLRGLDVSPAYGLAVGNNGSNSSYIYTFNGTTWSLGSGPIASSNFYDVACDQLLSPTTCWIVGQQSGTSLSLMYKNGVGYVPASSTSLMNGVSCNGGSCAAVGGSSAYNFLTSSTTPFTNVTTLSATLNQVYCPQANSCLAVRSTSSVYYYNGTTWTGPFTLSGGTKRGVHCPSNTICYVVGSTGSIFKCTLPVTSSASCVQQTAPGTLTLTDVHCNSTSDCLAVGTGTTAYRYTGGAWITTTLPASYTLSAVRGFATGSGYVVTPIVLHNQ